MYKSHIQADTGFSDEHMSVDVSKVKRRKADALARSLDGAPGDYIRQQAWLVRDEGDADDQLWRPPVLHRLSAKHWLERTDNQIRCSTVFKGWKTWQFQEGRPDWENPYKQPQIAVPIDLGGDGLCACNAATYKYDINAWIFPDFSHMGKGQFEGVCKMVGVWNFVLLLLITLNLNMVQAPCSDVRS